MPAINSWLSAHTTVIALCVPDWHKGFNTLRPRQHGCHFADGVLKCIFLNENVRIAIKISLKFVPNGPINDIPALVQVMAWRRPGDKPLPEPVMVRLPTNTCLTWLQWVNSFRPGEPYMHQWTVSSLVQVMAWWRTGDKPLLEPMITHSPFRKKGSGKF